MTKKLFFILPIIFVFSGCFGLLQSDLDPTPPEAEFDKFIEDNNISDDTPEVVTEERDVEGPVDGSEPRATRIDPDEQKAAIMFADTMCIVADPQFWEDFFGDEEDDFDEQRIYTNHGYSGKGEADAAIKKYWGKKDFKAEVKRVLVSRCDGPIKDAGVNVEEFLSGPKPQ